MTAKQYLASEHNWAKKLPTGWRYEFFGDLIKDTVDNRGRTVPTSDFGIPLIATNCISNSSLYPVFKDIRYVSQKTYDKWFRDGHAEPNDIIFVNKGTPGQICFIPDPINFCFAQDMIGLKVNHEKINSKYLFAVLRTKFMQEQIDAFHVGTLIPHFKKSDFNSIIIPIPPKKLEDLVGEYYFSISQKIESLQNQNKILEQTAQAIFKSWFVDFDGVTEFEDSELGQIPKGWEVETLKEIADVGSGKRPNEKSLFKTSEYNIPCYGSSKLDVYVKEALFEKPILITGRVGTLGIIHRVFSPCFSSDNTLTFMVKNCVFYEYAYFCLKQIDFQSYNRGTSQPLITQTDMKNIKIIIPPQKILESFSNYIKQFFKKIVENNSQIDTLTKTRDALLPKLMSGEIRV